MSSTDRDDLYLIIMGASSFILLIIWTLMMQQLCHTKLQNRTRLYNTTLLVIFSTLSLFNNALIYLVAFMPEYKLFHRFKIWILCYIVEPFALIMGFHIFIISQLTIIHNMYLPMNIHPPKWIKSVLQIVEFIYIAAVFFCYTVLLVLNDQKFAQIFYVFLMATVLILSLMASIIFCRLLRTLNKIVGCEQEEKLTTAKHGVRVGITLSIITCIVCIICGIIAVDIIFEDVVIGFNHDLIDAVFHSIFLFMISISLYLWIYQPAYCCYIRKRTVCDSCGCNDFIEFWCTFCVKRSKKARRNKRISPRGDNNEYRTAMLLEESSKRTILTGGTAGTMDDDALHNTNSKITDYNGTSIQRRSGPTPDLEDHTATATDERNYVKT